MHWILILWIAGGTQYTAIDFDSQTKCDTARLEIQKVFPWHSDDDSANGTWAICVEK